MSGSKVQNPYIDLNLNGKGGLYPYRDPSRPVPCTGQSLTFLTLEVRAKVLACTADVAKVYRRELGSLNKPTGIWSAGNPCPFCGALTLDVNTYFGSCKCSTCDHYSHDIVVFLMASHGICMEAACGRLEGRSHD